MPIANVTAEIKVERRVFRRIHKEPERYLVHGRWPRTEACCWRWASGGGRGQKDREKACFSKRLYDRGGPASSARPSERKMKEKVEREKKKRTMQQRPEKNERRSMGVYLLIYASARLPLTPSLITPSLGCGRRTACARYQPPGLLGPSILEEDHTGTVAEKGSRSERA